MVTDQQAAVVWRDTVRLLRKPGRSTDPAVEALGSKRAALEHYRALLAEFKKEARSGG